MSLELGGKQFNAISGDWIAALPNLTDPAFTSATTNGGGAGLVSSEQMQLIDANSNVIGSPSAPRNGFSACIWATSC